MWLNGIRFAAVAFCGAAACTGALPAFAQQGPDYWFLRGDKANIGYIDATSIVSDGDVKRGWIRLFYSAENSRFPLSNLRVLDEVNCRTRQERYLRFTQYERNGTVFSSQEPNAWSDVILRSLGEAELKIMCSSDEIRASIGTQLPQGMAPDEHAQQNFDYLNARTDSMIARALAGTVLPITPGPDAPP